MTLQETDGAENPVPSHPSGLHDGGESRSAGTPGTPPGPAPTTPTPGPSKTVGFVMEAINSAIALVKNPVAYITANKDKPATVNSIMIKYVAVLAAIPFVATLIGDLWYYSAFLPIRFAGSLLAYAFVWAILTYILDVIGVYVVGIVIGALGPTFKSPNDPLKSLRLSAYLFTPVFLIGILNIIPVLSVITFLGVLYVLYILYLGLPIVIGTPKESVVTYVIAIAVAALIIYVVIGFIVGLVAAAAFGASLGYYYY